MRHWRCWFREHQLERVQAKWPMVLPGAGLVIQYEPDPDGSHVACQRCGRVMPVEDRE